MWRKLTKYRDRSDIIASILRVAANASTGYATNTKIMYEAYLSYGQLKEYLAILVPANMLQHEPTNDSYRITPKGTEFLIAYERIQNLLQIEAQSSHLKYHFWHPRLVPIAPIIFIIYDLMFIVEYLWSD